MLFQECKDFQIDLGACPGFMEQVLHNLRAGRLTSYAQELDQRFTTRCRPLLCGRLNRPRDVQELRLRLKQEVPLESSSRRILLNHSGVIDSLVVGAQCTVERRALR